MFDLVISVLGVVAVLAMGLLPVVLVTWEVWAGHQQGAASRHRHTSGSVVRVLSRLAVCLVWLVGGGAAILAMLHYLPSGYFAFWLALLLFVCLPLGWFTVSDLFWPRSVTNRLHTRRRKLDDICAVDDGKPAGELIPKRLGRRAYQFRLCSMFLLLAVLCLLLRVLSLVGVHVAIALLVGGVITLLLTWALVGSCRSRPSVSRQQHIDAQEQLDNAHWESIAAAAEGGEATTSPSDREHDEPPRDPKFWRRPTAKLRMGRYGVWG